MSSRFMLLQLFNQRRINMMKHVEYENTITEYF